MENILKQENIVKLVTTFLVIVSLFFVGKTIGAFKEIKYIGSDVPAMNVISVNGKGEIVMKPDTATFTFSVTEELKTMKESQDAVSVKTGEIVQKIKDLGVSEDDIKTISYSSYPKYKYDYYCYGCDRGVNEIVGYVVSEQIELKVKDLERVADITTILAESKVENMYGPNFSVYDEDSVREEARALAINDAKDEAERLADELGVRLGRVVSYTDNEMYPYFYGSDMAESGAMAMDKSVAPSIELGTNTITENVIVTYEIR